MKKFLTIQLFIFIIFFTITLKRATAKHFYHQFGVSYDIALAYSIYKNNKIVYNDIFYSNEKSGNGFALHYSFIFSPIKTHLNIKKPAFGFGIMTDTSFIFNECSGLWCQNNFIWTAGIAAKLKILWLLNCYYGIGYAAFANKFYIINYYITIEKKSLNGPFAFLGCGIDIPFKKKADFFIQLYVYGIHRIYKNNNPYWRGYSLRFGLALSL